MITLKPTIRYWLMNNIPLILIIALLFIVPKVIALSTYVRACMGVVTFVLLCMIAWSYIVLLHVTYIIEPEQIVVKRGVFMRTTNFVEMYRIYDYEKRQNLLELWFRIMNVVLLSRDMSNPKTVFVGIQNSDDIIPIIRERVEKEKQRKSIVELNNVGGL